MSEHMEAEREAENEASRTEAAPGSESGAKAAKEQPTKRTRQVVPKRPRASAFKGEPSQKKIRTGSEAAPSTQTPEKIPSGTKGQEEEEEKEEAISALRPRGLLSKGPAVLLKVEMQASL